MSRVEHPRWGPSARSVWHRWDGERIVVWTDPLFGWVRALADDGRVVFVVQEHVAPARVVTIRGTATVDVGSIPELRHEIEPIVHRYIVEAAIETTIAGYDRGSQKAIVSIRPTSIRGVANLPITYPPTGQLAVATTRDTRPSRI